MACQFLLLGSDLDRPLESRKGCPSDMLKNLQEGSVLNKCSFLSSSHFPKSAASQQMCAVESAKGQREWGSVCST